MRTRRGRAALAQSFVGAVVSGCGPKEGAECGLSCYAEASHLQCGLLVLLGALAVRSSVDLYPLPGGWGAKQIHVQWGFIHKGTMEGGHQYHWVSHQDANRAWP